MIITKHYWMSCAAAFLLAGTPNYAADAGGAAQVLPASSARVEILGVSGLDSALPWRSVDGKPLAVSPMKRGMFTDPGEPDPFRIPMVGNTVGSGEQGVRLLVRVHDLAPGQSCDIKIPGNRTLVWRQGDLKHGGSLYAVAALLPRAAKAFTVRVGVTSMEWKDLADGETHDGMLSTSATLVEPGGADHDIAVVFSQLSLFGADPGLTITSTATDVDTRFVGVDAQGKTIAPEIRASMSVNDFKQETLVFPGMTLDALKSVKLQGRLYQWLEVKDIALPSGE
jgi:hypothetical protein